MRKSLIMPAVALALAAVVPLALPTLAAGQEAGPAIETTAIPADWMTVADLSARLSADGWTIIEIEAEIEEGKYEACLIGADGGEIEADIDPVTGEIRSQEADHCASEDGDDDDEGGDHEDGDHEGGEDRD